MITRGRGWPGERKAFWKKRFAVAASRWAESKKSIVAPLESMARYKCTTCPSPERRSHPPARSRWWASVGAGIVCLIRARSTEPNARWGGVVRRDAPLSEEFLDIPIGKGETQVPAHRTRNDARFVVAPFEQGGPGFAHQGIISGPRHPLFPALQHFQIARGVNSNSALNRSGPVCRDATHWARQSVQPVPSPPGSRTTGTPSASIRAQDTSAPWWAPSSSQ